MKRPLRHYQVDWWRYWESRPWSLTVGPRQVGKDHTLGLFAPLAAIEAAAKSPDAKLLCMNKDQRLSSSFLSRVARNVRVAERAGMWEVDHSSGSKVEVRLKDPRATIVALPSQPSSIQGEPGSVIWNEVGANRHDPEEIWSQIIAVASSSDYRVMLVSNATPRGSWLDHVLHSDKPHFAAMRARLAPKVTTIYDCYPDGLPPVLEEVRASMTVAAWQRWYECRFVDGGVGPLAELLQDLHLIDVGEPVSRPVMAVDVGVSVDQTGVLVIQACERGWRTLYHDLWHRVPVEEQINRLDALYRQTGCYTAHVDMGAQGYGVWQGMQSRFGDVVKGVSVNDHLRSRGLTILEDVMTQRRWHVPEGADDLCSHLGEVLRDERDKVVVPKVPNGSSGLAHHCDLADAAMIAACALGPVTERVEVNNPIRGRRQRSSGGGIFA